MNGENYTFDPSKTKPKTASIYLVTWGVKEGSVLHNGDLTVSYEMMPYSSTVKVETPDQFELCPSWTALVVSVKSNADRTLYLDLGNTFIVRGGNAAPYYVSTATSSTSVTSGGVGVNMEAVAGTLGGRRCCRHLGVGRERERRKVVGLYQHRLFPAFGGHSAAFQQAAGAPIFVG